MMRTVAIILAFIVLCWLLLGMPAFAAPQVTVSWQNATKRTDNTPFTNLAKSLVWVNDCGSMFTTYYTATGTGNVAGLTGLSSGTHCFQVTHVDTAGISSAPSVTVAKSVPAMYGDINGDGVINTIDITMLRSVMNKPASYSAIAAASDLNGNGKVDTTDYTIERSLLINH